MKKKANKKTRLGKKPQVVSMEYLIENQKGDPCIQKQIVGNELKEITVYKN